MKVRNGKKKLQSSENAKLNFCHPVQKGKKMTLKVKKSNLLIAEPSSGYQ